jgi:hypothetical protein
MEAGHIHSTPLTTTQGLRASLHVTSDTSTLDVITACPESFRQKKSYEQRMVLNVISLIRDESLLCEEFMKVKFPGLQSRSTAKPSLVSIQKPESFLMYGTVVSGYSLYSLYLYSLYQYH